jgi:hypothetical protein
MINFRLRDEDLPRLDAACQTVNMTRSDFIRAAVAEKVNRLDGKTANKESMKAAEGRGKAKPKVTGHFPDCPKNPACQFQRTVTGIQVCTTCGLKRA